ncbi:MAG: phosphotransferase [Polyangiales bacterium]
MDESAKEGEQPESIIHWSSIEAGSELSATVVFAAGFALDPTRPVRESYRVQRKIGSGAMGQVLEVSLVGEQSQQHFALKLVARPRSGGKGSHGGSVDNPSAQQDAAMRWLTGLLRSEAAKQEAAQRHGVTVARFVALVRLDDGALGLRMEMARGRSWGALIEDENLRREQAPDVYRSIRAARKLLGQLRRVHSIREPGAPSGFVHSDIKPTNVFVDDADPTDPSVTLLDFGVATAGRAVVEDEAAMLGRETFILRQTGGTPGYAPPGHFNARPSPASDVHAAIVCLYELIALALPWDIDDIDPSPAGFAVMELRISSLPKSVRALRPTIPEAEARVLDRFFVSAFSDLQSRSLAWAGVANARDEAASDRRQKLTDELSALAGDYQRSLDALARELESLGITPPSVAPPSLLITPKSPKSAPLSVTTDGVSADAIDTAPTIVAATKSDPLSKAWADTESDVPIAVPLERRPWPAWAPIAAGSALLAAVVAITIRALAPSSTAVPDGGVAALDASSDGPERDAPNDAPSAVDPGVSLAVTPSSPLDLGALPRMFRSRRALAAISTPAHAQDAGRDSGASSGATVLCVASSRAVRVVARGGALDRDVVLCSTDTLSDPSTQEFAGRGEMDPEVLRALPTVQCSGEGRWLTSVRRFAGANGGQTWLFHCARPAPDPVEPSRPDAGVSVDRGASGSNEQDAAPSVEDSAPASRSSAEDAASQAATPSSAEPDAQPSQSGDRGAAEPSRAESDAGADPRPTSPTPDSTSTRAPEPTRVPDDAS